jgi:hypothetical protein
MGYIILWTYLQSATLRSSMTSLRIMILARFVGVKSVEDSMLMIACCVR